MQLGLSGLLVLLCWSTWAQAQKAHRELLEADLARQRGDQKAAVEGYRRAVAADSNSLRGHYNLGQALYEQQNYPQAAQHFERAAKLENGSAGERAQSYNNLGNAYFKQSDYPKAVEAYKQGLRLDPNNVVLKQNLAQAMRKMPKQDMAQQQQKKEEEKKQEQKNPEEEKKKKDAQNLSSIMNNEDKKVQQKLMQKQQSSQRRESEKNW